jgi:hypothetical protein
LAIIAGLFGVVGAKIVSFVALLGAFANGAILAVYLLSACLYRKLDSTVMVMKSAEDRHSCDAAYVLDGAMDRSVFAKRPMSPQLVIISGILRQDPA